MNTTNAGRNRTITINENEIHKLKQSISYIENINSEFDFSNSLINSDLFEVLDLLPNEFADLIIIDPPYNLDKNFNGLKFNKSL